MRVVGVVLSASFLEQNELKHITHLLHADCAD
jgi:hypothetical protein